MALNEDRMHCLMQQNYTMMNTMYFYDAICAVISFNCMNILTHNDDHMLDALPYRACVIRIGLQVCRHRCPIVKTLCVIGLKAEYINISTKQHIYTLNHKKRDISFLTITLANLNRFL